MGLRHIAMTAKLHIVNPVLTPSWLSALEPRLQKRGETICHKVVMKLK